MEILKFGANNTELVLLPGVHTSHMNNSINHSISAKALEAFLVIHRSEKCLNSHFVS